MEATHIKFSLNQVGLAIDYLGSDGEWHCLSLIKLDQPCYAKEYIDEWVADRKAKGFNIIVDSIKLA